MPNFTAVQKPPKFKRRAAARPDEVLDAAQILFLEKGFAATRVDDIATLAGISKGAVYLYFPNKQAIIEGLINRAIMPITVDMVQRLQSFTGNPKDLISMMMRSMANQLDDPKMLAIPVIVMREAPLIPQIAQLYKTKIIDKLLPAFVQMISTGMDNGYLRKLDPELTVRSLMGGLAAHILLSEFFGSQPTQGQKMSELIENHLSIIFDGLSNHI
uniref:TetR family transcriptional regulator n=1 Tax=OCS116 cluster bacterium TaxID=2030921 RepID=A0A2A4YXX4_9PROT